MKFFINKQDGIFPSYADNADSTLDDKYVLMMSDKKAFLLYNSGRIRAIRSDMYSVRKVNNFVKTGVWREIFIDELKEAGFKIE